MQQRGLFFPVQQKVDEGMGYKGELTGLGDRAYWTDLGQEIDAYTKVVVVKGKEYASVMLADSKPGLSRLDATKQLVNRILPHL